MNVYAVVVLATLLGAYALELVSTLLNLRALGPEVPPELVGQIDAERYRRSQEYTRARARLGLVSAPVHLAALLAFWGLGGFGALDRLVGGWGLGAIGSGLAYIGLLLALNTALSLPFALWSTFVVEERFGFNRTTPRLFVVDRLKGLAVGVCLGGPLLAAVLAFFLYAGEHAWLYAWGATAVFAVVAQIVVPAWVMPLFNRFSPMEEGELRSALLDYARRARFPLENVYVVDGSRRSTKSNAFFTGIGRHRRVALYDTLVERHTTEEIVAVLAHEIGHWRKRHVLMGTLVGLANTGALLFLLGFFLRAQGLYDAFLVDTPSVHVGLVLFGLLYAPVELLLSVLINALSRRNELAADRFAAETTGAPGALVTALGKLAAHNLGNLTPHPLHVALYHSHPPVPRRIAALRAAAAGGE